MDIEGKRLPLRPRKINNLSPLSSIFSKASALLGKDGKRGPAVLFLFLEAVSVVLDVFERSQWASLAAFLLSAFGFAINIYVCYLERTTAEIKPQAERQLGIVEIVFSVLQLIATLIHFILLVSDVKYNYGANPKKKLRLTSRQVKESGFFFLKSMRQIYEFFWNLIIRLIAIQRALLLRSFRLTVSYTWRETCWMWIFYTWDYPLFFSGVIC